MRHLIRSAVAAATAAGLAATVSLLGAAPAHAGNGGTETGSGYGAKVEVHVTGDVDRGLVASVPGPPPMCWWEDLSSTMLDSQKVDTSDPKAVEKYYEEEVRPWLTGHAGTGILAMPTPEDFKEAIQRAKAGEDMRWYALRTRDDADPEEIAERCGSTLTNGPYGPVLLSWRAFADGEQPPPAVDPEDLARYAYEVMDLVEPTLEWNPTLAALNDATLVNLPTWMWTEDPEAVEERSVTAEAAGVSVTVTAQPDGMTVTSPVVGTECSAEQARTAYAPGVDEASACVMTFPRGSAGYDGGFPVDATTGWDAEWTSNTGEGGDLEAKVVNATTTIPVIEVQSRVSEIG